MLAGMGTVDERAIDAASGQRGLATRAQLIEAGVSVSTITRRLGKKRWSEVVPGVVDLGTHEPDGRGRLQQLLLAAGSESWASHWSAAHLHRFLDVDEPASPDVLVRRGRYPWVDSLALHTTTAIDADETTAVAGLRCTTRARTLLDLSPQLGLEAIERFAADLARRDREAFRQLGILLARYPAASGRRRLLTALARLPGDVAELGSALEAFFAAVFRREGAPTPKLQYRVRDLGGALLKRVDFAWPDEWTIAEIDGVAWHGTSSAQRRDSEVRAHMRELGWTVEVFRYADLDGPRPAQLAARLRALRSDR